MKRAVVCILVAAACAGPEAAIQPEPPPIEGEGPGIGRLLELDLQGIGGPISLRAVTGRVTVVCVIREAGTEVARACKEAAERFGDRVTVVGLDTTGAIDPRLVPFRIYGDPGGDQLREKLDLDDRPQVIATDKRGRVSRVLGAHDLDVLDATLRRLVD